MWMCGIVVTHCRELTFSRKTDVAKLWPGDPEEMILKTNKVAVFHPFIQCWLHFITHCGPPVQKLTHPCSRQSRDGPRWFW